MPDMWMDVDTALAEVPVNFAPLIDDTDFKTIEDAVAYNATGMDLRWNFVTCAGAYTSTAVTPTTGGAYDWAHQGDGMYSIEIPASGGASINNDTEGFGWFSGKATGVLSWRGPVIGFRAAALNDAMIEGGDLLDVNITKIADTTQTAGDLAALINTLDDYVDAEVAAIKAKTDNLPTDPADESLLEAAIADLKTYVDTEVAAILAAVDTEVAAIKAKTDNLPASPANETTLTTIAAYIDTEVAAILAAVDTEVAAIKAKTDNLPTDPADESLLEAAIADLKTYVDTEVAAIKAKTDNLPTDPADESLLEAAIADLKTYVDTEVAAILAAVDTEVAAIKAKTDNLPTDPADQSAVEAALAAGVNVTAIDATTAAKIADIIIRRSFANARQSANGDTVSLESLLGAIAKLVNDIGWDGSDLVVKDETGAELGRQTATTDAAAEPVVGLETV